MISIIREYVVVFIAEIAGQVNKPPIVLAGSLLQSVAEGMARRTLTSS
jgi:hypothetical protein